MIIDTKCIKSGVDSELLMRYNELEEMYDKLQKVFINKKPIKLHLENLTIEIPLHSNSAYYCEIIKYDLLDFSSPPIFLEDFLGRILFAMRRKLKSIETKYGWHNCHHNNNKIEENKAGDFS